MSGTAAKLLLTMLLLVATVACGPAAPPSPTPPPSKAPIDYVALEAEIEQTIRTGPATLDNVRAVLVNVDGETKIAHYRHDFTEDDYLHVFSVTKSVLSILIGIAIADGLIAGLDQPLSELLPGPSASHERRHRPDHSAPADDHVGRFRRLPSGRG